jgi:hypothetical protein
METRRLGIREVAARRNAALNPTRAGVGIASKIAVASGPTGPITMISDLPRIKVER